MRGGRFTREKSPHLQKKSTNPLPHFFRQRAASIRGIVCVCVCVYVCTCVRVCVRDQPIFFL